MAASRHSIHIVLPVAAGFGALFEPMAYPFLFPGLLLFLVPCEEWSLSDRLAHMAFASLAFWMAALWPLSLTGLRLNWFCHGVTFLTLAAYAWLAFGRGRTPQVYFRARDVVVLAVMGLVTYLRLRPLFVSPAPSGADMSMHAYIVRLLVDASGVPESYLPLLGVEHFSAFPVGFHTIAAMFSLLGGHPAWWSAFVMGCLSHALFCVGLYVLAREMAGWREGLVVAVAAALLLRDPQSMAGWGGNPTVLALAFVPMLLVAERMARRGRGLVLAGGLCLLYLLGLCMTHGIVFVQTFYMALPALLAALAFGPRPGPGYWKTLAVTAGFFLVLSLPFVLHMDMVAIDGQVRDWIRDWVRNTGHAWHGSAIDALWTIPAYVRQRLTQGPVFFWALLGLAGLGAARLWAAQRELLAWCLAFLAGGWLLILNCRYWLLPASYLIYPERVAAMLVIPLAVLAAVGLGLAADLLGREGGGGGNPEADGNQGRLLWQAALAVVLVFGVFDGELGYVSAVANESAVTASDLQAIQWIAGHTPPDAVIETNYVDAGLWVPAVAGRRTTNPHVNIAVYFKNHNPSRGDYVFTGAKPVYGEPPLKARDLAAQPEHYELVFRSGSSCVFKRLD